MSDWLHALLVSDWLRALLVGAGCALWAIARHIEKMEGNVSNTDVLKKFDEHWANPATQQRIAQRRAEEGAYQEQQWKAHEERLNREPEATRQRFRRTLQGYWSNPDVVPYGHAYKFRGDGTGTCFHYSGFGCEELPFEWRCPEDWVVEMNIHYSSDDEAIEDNDEEDNWDRTSYDFIIADTGYGEDVVLCSQYIAEKYRTAPETVEDHDMGLDYHDGPLVFQGESD